MWTIRQNDDGAWELLDAEGTVASTHARYQDGVAALTATIGEQLAALDAEGDAGLLPEPWEAPVAFLSEATGPDRDFSDTQWIWRDPATSFVPLMFQTETEMGHFGARLAGFVTSIAESDGVGSMAGRFYDSDEGRQARTLLLDGRRYGVSVDPGEETVVDFECVEEDSDGFCVDERLSFSVYEVIGLTMTPFPGFATAFIQLDAAADSAPASPPAEPVAASAHECEECEERRREARAAYRASIPARLTLVAAAGAQIPVRPPAGWFDDPQLDRLTAPVATDEGYVYGHLAPWGQCHTGSAPGDCVLTPRSTTGYAYFRTGYVVADNGTEIATGPLTVGGGHADKRLSYRGAAEHYDEVGAAIADIAVGEDQFGIWMAGALRPSVTDEQLRIFRASPPSGDWRPIGAGVELVAACSVNSQGYPIARVASSGRVLALVAAGSGVMRRLAQDPTEQRLARLEREVAAFRAEARAPARARLRAHAVDRLRGARSA